MCYSIIKQSYGHISDDTVGADVRRIYAFHNWRKIRIKMEVEKDKSTERMYSEY